MNQRDLTDVDIERLLQGNADLSDCGYGALARVVDQIRTQYASNEVPPVGAQLAHFVDLNLVVNVSDLLAEATVSSEVSDARGSTRHHTQQVRASIRQRRNKARVAFVTFTGTLTAKVLFGGALALAAASGTQALGIVDIPLLPDFGQHHHLDNTPPHIIDNPPATSDHQPTGRTDTDTDGRGQTDSDGNSVDTGTNTRTSDDDSTDTTEADSTEADTTEADTTEADSTEADSTEADTAGADLNGAGIAEADVDGADSTDTRDAQTIGGP